RSAHCIRWLNQRLPSAYKLQRWASIKEPPAPLTGALAWGLVLVFITGIANAGIIGSPGKACALLREHAQPGWLASKTMALKLSRYRRPLYVDPSPVIAQVGHIPDLPYLTGIPGKNGCVAVSPTFLGTSETRLDREWLWLIGIAGTAHPHTYQSAVEAANNPVLRRVAGWFGIGGNIAKRAVLASECQATRWLPEPAMKEFQLIAADLEGNHYLPTEE
ncbi:hypothetical protein, partial [Acidithiobacillus caldus]|uniref:hypothetical protein n=1 Tax=Acidithiobacillus caldus TaxID=33059 RepID=UPI001D02A1D9